MIKQIGLWKEYTTLEFDISMIDELKDGISYDLIEKEKILGYLRSGTMIMASPGVLECLKCVEEEFAGSFSIFTDGEWIWPQYYIHYVYAHDIPINSEFIDKMRSRNYDLKPLSKRKALRVLKNMERKKQEYKSNASDDGSWYKRKLEKIKNLFKG